MARKAKIPYFCSLLLFILVATSFLSVKGWCVDKSDESVNPHIKLADCHSGFSVKKDIALFKVETSHSTANKHCTSCHDLTPDVRMVKLFDDSFGSPASAPSSNSIFPPHQYSDLTAFPTLSPGKAVANNQLSSWKTQQNKAIRTVVLVI